MNYKAFYTFVVRIFLVYIIGLVIFQFFRLAIVYSFSSWTELQNYKLDLFNAFLYMGFKYDTVVILYMLLIPFLLAIVSTFIPEKYTGFSKISLNIFFGFSFVLLTLSVILLTCDYYYFQFFQSHFNLLVFGLKDDDTGAVLHSMWTDYPIIPIFAGWIIVSVLLFIIIRKINNKNIVQLRINKPWMHAIIIILIIGLYGLGLRGSLGVFPIQKDDATISSNTFINSVTMNGIFSLKDAFADYKRFAISTDTMVTFKKYGYSNTREALNDLNVSDPDLNIFADTTSKSDFLEKNPPHVVFCLMESMSNYYFDLHSPSLNLMGELENQLNSCVVFRNFTSARNGTIHSLEGLVVNTPLTPISQSSFINIPLSSSVAKTYLDNGYETNFITGAKLGWRNIGKYLSTQYFKNVEGRAEILEKVNGAQTNEWGTYDEFVFQRVYDILKNAKKPQLIFIFSTTNHTPYQLPDNYKPFPVSINDSIRGVLRCDEEIALKNLTAYQYANNSIGVFIKNLKSSGLSENTIVAATGDHNTLALFDYDDAHLLMKYSVPLVMYIPDSYMPDSIDKSRFGSHKDIFPTLFNLSLSNSYYYKSGNNLFGSDLNHYYALNDNIAFDISGSATIVGKPMYYKWKNSLLYSVDESTPELNKLYKTAKARALLLELDIQKKLSISDK